MCLSMEDQEVEVGNCQSDGFDEANLHQSRHVPMLGANDKEVNPPQHILESNPASDSIPGSLRRKGLYSAE